MEGYRQIPLASRCGRSPRRYLLLAGMALYNYQNPRNPILVIFTPVFLLSGGVTGLVTGGLILILESLNESRFAGPVRTAVAILITTLIAAFLERALYHPVNAE